MKIDPLVSVIVPTYNNVKTLQGCLESIQQQTYKKLEIIVVDNHSTDTTLQIARQFTDDIYIQGPERSAQTNFGVQKAQGAFVYKIDADFIIDPEVIAQCVAKAQEGFDAVVVHNSPDVRISWIAKIRKFEVDMYKYDLTHSSARFVKKAAYLSIGGFNPAITAGEDYDFQNKLNRAGYKTGFIDAEALHLGEPTKFLPHMQKYFAYGRDFIHYKAENQQESISQLGFLRSVYMKHWRQFVRHPLKGTAFVGYNFCKYGFGAAGYALGRLTQKKEVVSE